MCEIDAFCCDNWDDDCNRRVTSAGCVDCNCIRRKWDPEANKNGSIFLSHFRSALSLTHLRFSEAGGCEVLISTQQFCEDPFRGNGRWEVICIVFDNQIDVLKPGNQERFIFNAKVRRSDFIGPPIFL